MALVFNPPPNWPAPPAGWFPTPTWRPNPAWGPIPDGWQLWVEEPDPAPLKAEEALVEDGTATVEIPRAKVPGLDIELVKAKAAEAKATDAKVAEVVPPETAQKPMRYLTQVSLQDTELPERVLNLDAPANNVSVAEAPAKNSPVAEQSAQPAEAKQIVTEQTPATTVPTVSTAAKTAAASVQESTVAQAQDSAVAKQTAQPVVAPAKDSPAAEQSAQPIAAKQTVTEQPIVGSPLVENRTPAAAPKADTTAPAATGVAAASASTEPANHNAPAAPAENAFSRGQAQPAQSQDNQFQGQPQYSGQYLGTPAPAGAPGAQAHMVQPQVAQNQPAAFNPYVAPTGYAQQTGEVQGEHHPAEPQNAAQQADPGDTSSAKGRSGGKLWGLIAAIIALLVIAILAIVMLIPRGGSNKTSAQSADSAAAVSTASSAGAQSTGAAGSSAAALTAGEAKLPKGEFNEYKQTVTDDKQTINVEKINGDASKGILYYEFKPSGKYDEVAFISSRDDQNDATGGVSVVDTAKGNTTTRGTVWVDTANPSSPTHKLELVGKGEWTIRIYDESSAPNYGKGDKFQTTMPYYAYTYNGGESTFEVQANNLTNRGFSILDANRNETVFAVSMTNVKSNLNWNTTGKNYLQIRAGASEGWSISAN